MSALEKFLAEARQRNERGGEFLFCEDVPKLIAIIRVMREALEKQHEKMSYAPYSTMETCIPACKACKALEHADRLAGEADGK